MKTLIRLEEAGILALSVFLLYKLDMHLSWWVYTILFFSPDIGMLGYLVNTKVGAITYNLFHHKAVAALILIAGVVQSESYFLLAGLLLFAHSSFDRILGYGLKYPDHFKHTSIGSL
jgi:hypothetical protein